MVKTSAEDHVTSKLLETKKTQADRKAKTNAVENVVDDRLFNVRLTMEYGVISIKTTYFILNFSGLRPMQALC